jgi:hypothetical protein
MGLASNSRHVRATHHRGLPRLTSASDNLQDDATSVQTKDGLNPGAIYDIPVRVVLP